MRRLLLPAIAAVLLLSGCSLTSDPYAAKIDGKVISTETIDKEIEAVTSNPRTANALNEQLAQAGGLNSGGENTLNTQYTTNVVYTRILATLFENELKRLNLSVTPEQRASAEQNLRSQPEESAAIDGFPANYRDYLIDRQAQLQALLDDRSTPQKISDYYDEHKAEFGSICVRHIILATEAQATDVRNRIAGGGDFAAIANEEAAKEGAQANGGELGCYTEQQQAQLPSTFTDAIKTLPVGDLSQPVQTSFGFHIIQVKSRDIPTLEQATPQVKQKIADPQQLLIDLLTKVSIVVNPRYGDYVPSDLKTSTPGQIVPHRATGLQPPVAKQPQGAGGGADGLLGGDPSQS